MMLPGAGQAANVDQMAEMTTTLYWRQMDTIITLLIRPAKRVVVFFFCAINFSPLEIFSSKKHLKLPEKRIKKH
jgi:hypothetical protein